MAYENAKRILRNAEMRIAQSAEGIYDEDIVIGFWENIEARYIDECIRWMNEEGNRVVTGPSSFSDVEFTDDLYHTHAYYSEENQRLYRLFVRNPIISDAHGLETTKWKIASGQTYTNGQSTLSLAMYNVSPEHALALQTAPLEEIYTDEIYLLTGVLLDGEWTSRARKATVSEKSGLYTIHWALTRSLSNEFGFIYRDGLSVITELSVVDASETLLEEFLDKTYLDSEGNWYHSANGTTYTKLNGNDVTGEAVAFPAAGAYKISESIPGRLIKASSRFDEREKNWNLQLEVTHRLSIESGFFYKSGNNETTMRIVKRDCSLEEKDRFFNHYWFDSSGNWYEEDPNDLGFYNRVSGNAVAPNVSIPADAEKLTVHVPGRMVQVKTEIDAKRRSSGGTWEIEAYIVFSSSDGTLSRLDGNTRIEVASSKDKTLYTEKGSGLTETELTTIRSYYDGPAERGTLQQLEVKRNDNGTFDFVGTTSTRDSDGILSRLDGNDRLEVATSKDQTLYTEKGFGLDEAELTTIRSYYEAAAPAGTIQQLEVSRNEDGTFDFVGTVATRNSDDTLTRSGTNGHIEVASSKDRTVYTEKGFGLTEAELETFRAYYETAAPVGTLQQFEVQRNEDGTFDFVGTVSTRGSDGTLSRLDGNTRIQVASSKDKTLYIEKGFGLDEGELTTLRAFYDGPAQAGTLQQLEVKRNDDGTFDFVGTVSTRNSDETLTRSSTNGRLEVGASKDTTVYTEKGFGLDEGELQTFRDFYDDPAQVGTLQQLEVSRNEDGTFDFVGTVSTRGYDGTLSRLDGNDRIQVASGKDKTTYTEKGFGVTETELTTIRDLYDAPAERGTIQQLEVRRNEDGTFDFVGTVSTRDSDQTLTRMDLTIGGSEIASSRDKTVYTEKGFGLDEAELAAIRTFYGATAVEGVTQQFEVRRNEDGTFDFVGTRSTRNANYTLSRMSGNSRIQVATSKNNTLYTEKGFGVPETSLTAIRNLYDDPAPAGTLQQLEVERNEDGTFDFMGTTSTRDSDGTLSRLNPTLVGDPEFESWTDATTPANWSKNSFAGNDSVTEVANGIRFQIEQGNNGQLKARSDFGEGNIELIAGHEYKYRADLASVTSGKLSLRINGSGQFLNESVAGVYEGTFTAAYSGALTIWRGDSAAATDLTIASVQVWDIVNTRIQVASSKNRTTYTEKGFGVSEEELDIIRAFYDDPAPAGTFRKLEVDLNEDGTFDFVGIVTSVAGFAHTLTLGLKKFYIGRGMEKPATSDPSADTALYHILSIPNDRKVSGRVRPDENDTWAWDIEEQLPVEVAGGGTNSGDSLVTFGLQDRETVQLWEYRGQTALPNGGSSDLGAFASDGKSVTVVRYSNIGLDEASLTYRWTKIETTYSAPTGLFYNGGKAIREDDSRIMWSNGSHQAYGSFSSYRAFTLDRHRTVRSLQSLEFFVRHPENSDIAEHTAIGIATYADVEQRIVKLGEYLYALIQTTVTKETWASGSINSFAVSGLNNNQASL